AALQVGARIVVLRPELLLVGPLLRLGGGPRLALRLGALLRLPLLLGLALLLRLALRFGLGGLLLGAPLLVRRRRGGLATLLFPLRQLLGCRLRRPRRLLRGRRRRRRRRGRGWRLRRRWPERALHG